MRTRWEVVLISIKWSGSQQRSNAMICSCCKTIFLLDPFHRRGRVLDRKFCLWVCLWICPSSLFPSPIIIIWWLTSCKPNIFWKHITLATSTALFWPSTTKYQPVLQYTDPVPPTETNKGGTWDTYDVIYFCKGDDKRILIWYAAGMV